jgi:hypothetical protein
MTSIWGSQQNATAGLNPKGGWNALTNTPFLQSGVGIDGDYYIVNTGGSTNLDGTTSWSTNDWALFSGSVWRRLSGGLTAGINSRDLLTVTVNGQTAFTLSTIPAIPNLSILSINGIKQRWGIDYSIAATSLTWTNASFTLETTDHMDILY